jgi:prepilin-type N-terminal cleavage/methylation domain-containing protein
MKRRAFTLVELLVVIAIIGLLSTVAIVALGQSQVNARNQKRKADLLQLSKALELHYSDHDAYPSTGGGWCTVTGVFGCSSYTADSGANGWIPGLSPDYMGILPRDPNSNKPNPRSPNPDCRLSGNASSNVYAYRSNDGTDYKLLAHCTPEGTMSPSDFFLDPTRPTWAWQVSSPGGLNY